MERILVRYQENGPGTKIRLSDQQLADNGAITTIHPILLDAGLQTCWGPTRIAGFFHHLPAREALKV